VRAAAAKDRPEMAELWFMRLRHTAVVRLGEAGVNVPQIASITGHTLKTCYTILERYNVRTDKMAVSAFQQRLDAEQREREKQG
jgi:transposase